MALFVLADPHLGFGVNKPMAVFGSHWQNHEQRLALEWRKSITDEDTVVLPGDISWAMNLSEALPDLAFLDRLPGRKILLRGNHDYWWSSMKKIQAFCADNNLLTLSFLRNNALFVPPDWVVCGTRGWIVPGDADFGPGDEKIYLREIGRLRLSLEAARSIRKPKSRLIACLHYPPFARDLKPTDLTELLEAFSVDICVYGHIHSDQGLNGQAGPPGRVGYQLASADYLNFKPLRL
ncbi:MAG: metallophosphoesterase [Saccharofermentanales bacterium]|jgi:predicted phosphohydrolase|nr:serine/threonine protein phosphatase [Clostridiaceae bacterium]